MSQPLQRSRPEAPGAPHAVLARIAPVEPRRSGAASGRSVPTPARPALVPDAPPGEPLARLLVRDGERLLVVKVVEIDWIESAGNYVRLHRGGEAHLVRWTLAALVSRLDPRRFVRAHRTALVNLEAIEELGTLPAGGWSVRLRGGVEIPLARRLRGRLLAAVGGR